MNILIDDTPLRTAHAGRGIGTYTRHLIEKLQVLKLASVSMGDWKAQWKHVDLIHFPFLDLFSASLPSIRKPVVVTIHDVIPLQFPDFYPVGKRGQLNLWRQKRTLRKVTAVITDSQASKQAIHSYLAVPLTKINVISLAADPDLHAPNEETQEKVTKKYQLPSIYILYVGDINYNKNLPQLIKTLKFLDENIHLVLLGRNFKEQNIPEWRAIEQQIALSDVANRVHFLTDVKTGDASALASIYAQSLCYIQPSLAEGFGLPVLDALQVGTPVIASNRTSLPEVGGSATHYVEPTAEAFAQAVNEIATYDNAKRLAVIKAGQQHAATFTWENTARKTIAVYQKVLGIE